MSKPSCDIYRFFIDNYRLLLLLLFLGLGIFIIVFYERRVSLIYFGGPGIIVTAWSGLWVAQKICSDSIKNRKLEKIFIVLQAVFDLFISVTQEFMWVKMEPQDKIPPLKTATGIIVFFVYAVLIVLMTFAVVDLIRIRYRQWHKSGVFKIFCLFIMCLLLGLGVYLVIIWRKQRESLFMVQIVPCLILFFLVILNYWLTQREKGLKSSKILNHNWLVFLFVIGGDLWLGLCSEYTSDNVAPVLDNIFEVIFQYMGLANYWFYNDWLDMEKESQSQPNNGNAISNENNPHTSILSHEVSI